MPRPFLYGCGVFVGTISLKSFYEEGFWIGLIVAIIGSFIVSLIDNYLGQENDR